MLWHIIISKFKILSETTFLLLKEEKYLLNVLVSVNDQPEIIPTKTVHLLHRFCMILTIGTHLTNKRTFHYLRGYGVHRCPE